MIQTTVELVMILEVLEIAQFLLLQFEDEWCIASYLGYYSYDFLSLKVHLAFQIAS